MQYDFKVNMGCDSEHSFKSIYTWTVRLIRTKRIYPRSSVQPLTTLTSLNYKMAEGPNHILQVSLSMQVISII